MRRKEDTRIWGRRGKQKGEKRTGGKKTRKQQRGEALEMRQEQMIGNRRRQERRGKKMEKMRGGVQRRLSPSVTTDGLSSAPYIRLPSDQKLPLTLTFGLPPHTRAHTDFSIMSGVSKDLVVKTLPHIVLYLKINTQKYVHLFIFL